MAKVRTAASRGIVYLDVEKVERYKDLLYELHELYDDQVWTMDELLKHLEEGKAPDLRSFLAVEAEHLLDDHRPAKAYGYLFASIRRTRAQLEGWGLERVGTHKKSKNALYRVIAPPLERQPELPLPGKGRSGTLPREKSATNN